MQRIKEGQGSCEHYQMARGDNKEADLLVKMAAAGTTTLSISCHKINCS